MFKNALAVVMIIAIIAAVVVAGPLLVIWAANVIVASFTTATIPYTISTWLAVLIIGVFMRSNVKVSKKN
jgi:hypothetical protein